MRYISKRPISFFTVSSVLLLLAKSSLATTAVMLSDEQLITSSRCILIGEVKSVKAQWDAGHQWINSYVQIRIEKVLKGQFQNEQIVFKQLGGTVGDESSVIFGAPEYKLGKRVLLFLDTAQDGTLRIAHLFQGKYDVIDRSSGRKSRVKRNIDTVNILGAREGPEITNEATLAKFEKKINRALRANAGEVAAFDARFEGIPIVEIPPEYVDSPPGGDLGSDFTLLGHARWFEPDSGQPVAMRVNPNGSPTPGGGNTEINQAFAAWTNVQTTSLVLQNGGSTTAFGWRADGTSAISFNDPLDQMSDPVGCSGTLAIGGYPSASGQTTVIGGQVFNRIVEGDVVFNRNFSCFLGISANLAEVATHETGHAIGFDHSPDSNAIMYYLAHGSGRGPTLGSDDIAAVSFLYPGSKTRFSDVPLSHPYYSYIEKIAQRGVTSGCGGGKYCPDDKVPRDQMSVFIERAIGMFNPPTPASQAFVDVPTNFWAYKFIGDFASRGITAGCTPTTYCPGDLVTRDQMAVFMERALGRSNPPTPTSQRFVDVAPTRWSYAFVESFSANAAARGILNEIKTGCNADGLHFCPDKPLSRAEMAAWLVIAFGL